MGVLREGDDPQSGGQNGSRSDGTGFAYILIMHDKTGALGAGHTAMGVVLSDGTVRYLSKDGFDKLDDKGNNTNFSDEPRSGLNTLLNSPKTERYTEFLSIGMTDKQAISIKGEMRQQIRTHYDLWYAHCMAAISTSLFLNSGQRPGYRELPGFNPGYSLQMKTPNWQFNHAKQYYDYFKR